MKTAPTRAITAHRTDLAAVPGGPPPVRRRRLAKELPEDAQAGARQQRRGRNLKRGVLDPERRVDQQQPEREDAPGHQRDASPWTGEQQHEAAKSGQREERRLVPPKLAPEHLPVLARATSPRPLASRPGTERAGRTARRGRPRPRSRRAARRPPPRRAADLRRDARHPPTPPPTMGRCAARTSAAPTSSAAPPPHGLARERGSHPYVRPSPADGAVGIQGPHGRSDGVGEGAALSSSASPTAGTTATTIGLIASASASVTADTISQRRSPRCWYASAAPSATMAGRIAGISTSARREFFRKVGLAIRNAAASHPPTRPPTRRAVQYTARIARIDAHDDRQPCARQRLPEQQVERVENVERERALRGEHLFDRPKAGRHQQQLLGANALVAFAAVAADVRQSHRQRDGDDRQRRQHVGPASQARRRDAGPNVPARLIVGAAPAESSASADSRVNFVAPGRAHERRSIRRGSWVIGVRDWESRSTLRYPYHPSPTTRTHGQAAPAEDAPSVQLGAT